MSNPAVAVALLAGCFPSLASDQPALALDQLGRIIASEWDATNGVPVEVSDQVDCLDYWTECDAGRLAPRDEVSSMVASFASARGVRRIEHADDRSPPRCGWSEAYDPAAGAPRGLRVQFQEPFVEADSARVVVMTGCQVPGRLMSSFGQVHEFIFRRGPDGSWALMKRQLILET